MDYRLVREKEMNVQLARLDKLIEKEQIVDKHFIDWAISKVKYAAGKDFCLFPFLGRINKTLNETDDYFSFVENFYPKNDFIISTQSYANYLNILFPSLRIIANTSDKYVNKRTDLDEKGLSRFSIRYEVVLNTLERRELEIALTNLFLNSVDIPAAYIDSLNTHINIDEIKRMAVIENYSKTSILDLLKEFDLNAEEKQPLIELYESVKGKVVFHDFWFLDCAPCMKELPHYNELIKQSGDEVEFIFFGAYMKEKDWKNGIAKFQLKGKHHLLTKQQIAFFERYFKLKSFPHHHLIHKNGLISDKGIRSVDPDNFEDILSIIEAAKLAPGT